MKPLNRSSSRIGVRIDTENAVMIAEIWDISSKAVITSCFCRSGKKLNAITTWSGFTIKISIARATPISFHVSIVVGNFSNLAISLESYTYLRTKNTNIEEKEARSKSKLVFELPGFDKDPHEESSHVEKYFWSPTSITFYKGEIIIVDSNRHRLPVYLVS